MPDDCDLYPDDPKSYSLKMTSYQTTDGTSAGDKTYVCYVTDRGDRFCSGTDGALNGATDYVVANGTWIAGSDLCNSGSSTPFSPDPSNPIPPSDDYGNSDPLPDPGSLDDDDLTLDPDDFTDPSNVTDNDGTGSGDYARTQDVKNLSLDQQNRLNYLNQQQNTRNENLKEQIRESAEFLNNEEFDRDQASENNADARHNDLKTQLDEKFSSLDLNQEHRNTSLNTALDSVSD